MRVVLLAIALAACVNPAGEFAKGLNPTATCMDIINGGGGCRDDSYSLCTIINANGTTEQWFCSSRPFTCWRLIDPAIKVGN